MITRFRTNDKHLICLAPFESTKCYGVSASPQLSWNDVAHVGAFCRLAAITPLTHLNFDVPLLQCNAVMLQTTLDRTPGCSKSVYSTSIIAAGGGHTVRHSLNVDRFWICLSSPFALIKRNGMGLVISVTTGDSSDSMLSSCS